MRYPFVGLCIAFCSGIITAAYLKLPFSIFYLLAALSLIFIIIFIKQNTKFNILILCSAFFLGAALLKNSQTLPNCHIAKLIPYGSESVSLMGTIDNDPVYQGGKASFILKAEKLGINETWQKACGSVLIRVSGRNEFSYADRLFLRGRLYRPFSFSKSKFNYRDYLKRQGIYLVLGVKKQGVVKQLGKNSSSALKPFAFQVRHKMRDIIVKNLSPFSAAMLSAIILGERRNLPVYIRDAMVKSGTVHIIAISGLHLGIAAFIILLTLRIIKIPRRLRYIFAISLLIIYCVLTGAKPPVVRATVMASILFFGYFLKREINIYNSLSIAALIILAINPWQLFEVGFQLSFLSVVSIAWLPPKIKSLFPEKLDKIPLMHFLIPTFSVSLAAWLGLLPLIAYYFRVLSPITVLANMIIVPYMTIIVASGFSLALAGILVPSLAPAFAASNELFIVILFKLNSLLISIPGAYFQLLNMPFVYVLLYYALLVSVTLAQNWRKRIIAFSLHCVKIKK